MILKFYPVFLNYLFLHAENHCKLDNKKLASIPILAMTANAFAEDQQEALKCGMNGHLAKPIDVGKLLDALNKY